MNLVPLRIDVRVDAVIDEAAQADLEATLDAWVQRHFSDPNVALLQLGDIVSLVKPDDVTVPE